MISKRIDIAPKNDNYALLANYIAAAKHHHIDKEIGHEHSYYTHTPEPHLEPTQNLARKRLCRLSERGLASRQLRQRQKGRAACLLSIDARSDRRPYDLVRRQISPPKGVTAQSEKCLVSWFKGGLGGDDYAEGIAEAVDVQAMNTRTTKGKTYHLVVSFRPEDESRLTPELYKEIEERFAHALGYTEHQRHCGVHKNTGNLHMHIAYNMIHPERFTRHEPFRDYHKRNWVCRALEKEHGLVVDCEIKKETGKSLQPGAASVEAHTGQLSFEGYAQQHKEEIMQAMSTATTWEEAHTSLARRGMEIVPHGNGLAIRDRHNLKSAKHAMKASALDRSLSLKKLEARFGAYKIPGNLSVELSRYDTTTPIHRAPERGELFTEFRQGIEQRKLSLNVIKTEQAEAEKAIVVKWAKKRQEVETSGLGRAAKARLTKLARVRQAEELLEVKTNAHARNAEVTAQIPFTTWVSYLQQKATQGSEVALAILRSRSEEVAPDTPQVKKSWSDELEAKTNQLKKQREVLTDTSIAGHTKTKLLSMAYMQEVAPEAKCNVDKKGTLIFTLEDGSTIRDNGTQVFFSPQAKEQARQYAQKKWGKGLAFGTEAIMQKRTLERMRYKQVLER